MYKHVYKYRCMLNKCKINSLAVINQVSHFCKTTVVPDFHLLATKL